MSNVNVDIERKDAATPFGCALAIIGAIATVWLLFHLSNVWGLFDHALRALGG